MIRRYKNEDLPGVISCFGRSVLETGSRYYTPEQVAVWAPENPDTSGWGRRLGSGGVFVAYRDRRIAGFVRAEETGLIDLLYVHPEYGRQDIDHMGIRFRNFRMVRDVERHLVVGAKTVEALSGAEQGAAAIHGR